MKKILKWTLAAVVAISAVATLGPEVSWARGGGGGGRGGGGGGGGRSGGGRSGGGRSGGGRSGGSRGASRGGRGGANARNNKKFKDAADYLEYLQREEADYLREDFQFGARDESLVTERDVSRNRALEAEREAGARARRAEQEADSHPY